MEEKKKEEPKIVEVSAPATPLSPLLANLVDVSTHPEIVVLDFGFIAPRFGERDKIEVTQIARICLNWSDIEELSEMFNDAITNHKKSKPKTKKKG